MNLRAFTWARFWKGFWDRPLILGALALIGGRVGAALGVDAPLAILLTLEAVFAAAWYYERKQRLQRQLKAGTR